MRHSKLYLSGATLPRLIRAEFGLPLWGLKALKWVTLSLSGVLGVLSTLALYIWVIHSDMLPVEPVIALGVALLASVLWHLGCRENVAIAEELLTPVGGYDLTQGPFCDHVRGFNNRVQSCTEQDARYLQEHASEHTHTVYVFWRLMRAHVGEA